MPLQLVTLNALPGGFVAKYTVRHSTPGREGTTLDSPLTLCVTPGKVWCDIEVKECIGVNPDEALDRMVVWLRRLADGLEDRKPSTPLPLG